MPDQTAVPTYAELMDRAIRAEEKIVRLISEAERTEERLTDERNDARARVAELEADHARLVEDVASTVRRFSATLDERDALRARVAELEAEHGLADRVIEALDRIEVDRALEAAQSYREVWSDEVAPGGRVCSICGHPVESEPCPKHAPDGYVVGWKYDGQLHIAYDEAEPSYATAGEARVVAAECCCEDPATEFRVYELREVSDRG